MNLKAAPGQAPGRQISSLVITEFSQWRAGLSSRGMNARPFQQRSLRLCDWHSMREFLAGSGQMAQAGQTDGGLTVLQALPRLWQEQKNGAAGAASSVYKPNRPLAQVTRVQAAI